MGKLRRYNIEGAEFDVPLIYDERLGIYWEEYPDFIENPVYTSNDAQIMFTGEDACVYAEAAADEACIDCGSCRFYRQLPHTLIGVCGHEKKKSFIKEVMLMSKIISKRNNAKSKRMFAVSFAFVQLFLLLPAY